MAKYVLVLYLFHVSSVVIHEIGHFIVAYLVLKSWDEISFGNFFYFNFFKKVKVSPIIFSAYVGVDSEVIFNSKIYKIVLFFAMGPLMNLLIGIILFLCPVGGFIGYIFCVMNLLYFILGLIPLKGSDLYNMVKIIKHKKKYLL